MLGDFFTRILVLMLGYAYPAFECYKTVERNKVEIEQLRFWCQYWIIVAFVTVLERFGDVLISWLPMYGEMKLVFFIYLWHPKTMGTGYVYQALLQPYVSKHETDIDRKIMEWRARAWDFTLYYLQNCFNMGQTTFFQVLQYLATQSANLGNRTCESGDAQGTSRQLTKSSFKKGPAPPRTPPPTPNGEINRALYERSKSELKQLQPDSPRQDSVQIEDDSSTIPDSPVNDKLQQARLRLRRSNLAN